MTTDEHIEKLFNNLMNASDEEREAVYAELRAQAKAHPQQFIDLIRKRPLDQDNYLFEFYEAIGPDAAHWSDFIVDEVHRLLDALEDPDNGTNPHRALDGLYTIDNPSLQERIKEAMLEHARSESVRARRAVVSQLPCCEDCLSPEVREVLVRYTEDQDWRVRVLAQQALNEEEGDYTNTGVRLTDRLRMRVFDLHHWQ